MSDDELRPVPAGASDAECEVCLRKTLNLITALSADIVHSIITWDEIAAAIEKGKDHE